VNLVKRVQLIPGLIGSPALKLSTGPFNIPTAFRKILDMTPIEYLIRLRLHRARQNLLEENEASASVSRVALDWGLWHLGEFSIAYRKCFDEMPSQTLNRSPGQQ
jgi:AraC-like DNA-binding protein